MTAYSSVGQITAALFGNHAAAGKKPRPSIIKETYDDRLLKQRAESNHREIFLYFHRMENNGIIPASAVYRRSKYEI